MKREKGKKKKSLIKGFLIGTFTVLVSLALVYFLAPYSFFLCLLDVLGDMIVGSIIAGTTILGALVMCNSKHFITIEYETDAETQENEDFESEKNEDVESEELELFQESQLHIVHSKQQEQEEELVALHEPEKIEESSVIPFAYSFDNGCDDTVYSDNLLDEEIVDDMQDMDMTSIFDVRLEDMPKVRKKGYRK